MKSKNQEEIMRNRMQNENLVWEKFSILTGDNSLDADAHGHDLFTPLITRFWMLKRHCLCALKVDYEKPKV